MLTQYIQEAMGCARYKILADGTYFGEIPGLAGVCSDEATLEECRSVLQEVLEGWSVLKLRDNDPIPPIGQTGLTIEEAKVRSVVRRTELQGIRTAVP